MSIGLPVRPVHLGDVELGTCTWRSPIFAAVGIPATGGAGSHKRDVGSCW